jgi:glutamine amidotransferase/cyclase
VLCRSGADKVSIGSDAVEAAEQYYASGCKLSGTTAIEEISRVYGKQAVVVSIDPRRVYVSDPSETTHTCVKAAKPGPNGERWCWWQCTVMGGREGRDIDAVQVRGCLVLGAHVLGCGRRQDSAQHSAGLSSSGALLQTRPFSVSVTPSAASCAPLLVEQLA